MMHTHYDPLLDPACHILPSPTHPQWRGTWIWHPSQLTTHLHAHAIQATAARCSFVGYPGNYRQPVYHAHFRYQTTITQPQTMQWQTPAGRARIFVNGQAADFTRRELHLQPGIVSLVWIIDFCASLPCLIVDGHDIHSTSDWQTSLDGHTWTAAETIPHYNQPAMLPDANHELTVQILGTLVSPTPADATGAYMLSADTALILDFGHIELGTLQFWSMGPATLRITVGESLAEVCNDDPTVAEQRPLPPITSHATHTPHTLAERCVRFVRIVSDAPCTIDTCAFLARVAPVHYHGQFRCSDEQLNAIWLAGAATIHACLHDFYVDGLRRDGLPWADQLSEVQGADCLFFDTVAARHSLLALTLPNAPTAADLGIIDHPLLLPLSFHHDWMTRGDSAFIGQYLDRLRELLDLYHHLQDDRGLISAQRVHTEAPQRDKGWNFFPDWAFDDHIGPDVLGTPTYSHMILMRCFEIGAQLETTLGDAQRAHHYHHCAQQLRHTLIELFWDAHTGAFYNGLDRHGTLDRRYTAHAQVWGILTDLLPASAYAQVFANVIENPACRVASLSLNHHWEFAAYHKAGRLTEALATLRTVWGGWIAQGHRRFPEDFRPHADESTQLAFYGRPFANSLCHGWAGAAAVTLLSHGLLGISALAPGFTHCQIAPQLGGLAWIQGSLPTPHGNISVAWDGVNGELQLPAITAQLIGCTTKTGLTHIQGPGTFALLAP